MLRRSLFGALAAPLLLLATAQFAAAAPGAHRTLFAPRGSHLPFGGSQHAVCGQAGSGAGKCLIHVLAPAASVAPARSTTTTISTPSGLPPSTIESVYGYTTSPGAGAGQTIALVNAYNDPNAAADLSHFSAQYGLPAADFTQVNQTGGSALPATNAGWDLEISLDIEWAHALAPGAKILLVEASTNSLTNLLAAEQYAAAHANYVSNSWGSSEFSGEAAYDSYFAAPGVSYFAAAGDEGGSLLWPSASPNVTSVGGTDLTLTSGGTLAQESVWSGSGGGLQPLRAAQPEPADGQRQLRGQARHPRRRTGRGPQLGRLGVRQRRLRRTRGLVDGRWHERLHRSVGGRRGRVRQPRERPLRVRRPGEHSLPRHPAGLQRPPRAERFRPRDRP